MTTIGLLHQKNAAWENMGFVWFLTRNTNRNGFSHRKENIKAATENDFALKCTLETTRNSKKKIHRCDRIWFHAMMTFFQIRKDIDICLLELTEDIIETGRLNSVLLRTICLPKIESAPGSSCFTSGMNKESKVIDAVPLNLLNHTYCEKHS